MSGRALTPPPAIVVRFELEAAPKIIASWSSESDQDRIVDWLNAKPEYRHVIDLAAELVAREKAA